MKKLILPLAVILLQFAAFAQSNRIIRAKAGDDLAQVYSPNGFYKFSQFVDATLYLKTGRHATGILFNYNMFSGTMQFIDAKHDTLDMSNPADIDSMVLAGKRFVFNDGYLELVGQSDSVQLYTKLTLKINMENIGAYGMPNSTGSIQNVNTYSAGSAVYHLVLNQDVVLDEKVTLFFSNGRIFLKATKSNLLKLLPPSRQGKASEWIREHHTNFEREEDLLALLRTL